MTSKPVISAIVPVFNEFRVIRVFFNRIYPILKNTGLTFEIVFVDDGSSDESWKELVALREEATSVVALRLSRNFGKEAALSCGLAHSRGDACIPIDVDLQDPPELIPEMIRIWQSGANVVLCQRRSRKTDSFSKKWSAKCFYAVFNLVSSHAIPEDTGDFRLMDRRVVNAINRLTEQNRFMKGLFAWVGFQPTVIQYDRPERQFGASKWSLIKLLGLAWEGITSFSSLPLRIWSLLGLLTASVSFVYASFLLFRTLILGIDVPGYASIMVAMLGLGGVQMIGIGVLGEYLARTYIESKQRPPYIVQEIIGGTVDSMNKRSNPA